MGSFVVEPCRIGPVILVESRDRKDRMTIEGEYQIAEEGKEVSLTIKTEGEGKWRVQAKVAYNMSTLVTEKDGVFTAGPVMSTRMMPSPELQELEREISNLLGELTNIFKDGEDLIIEGGGSSERFKTSN